MNLWSLLVNINYTNTNISCSREAIWYGEVDEGKLLSESENVQLQWRCFGIQVAMESPTGCVMQLG